MARQNGLNFMPWIHVVDEHSARGELQAIYQKVLETRGKIGNIHRVFSLSPRTLEGHLNLYLAIMFGHGGLSRAQREMIAVAVSEANRCGYCVAHHSAALSQYVHDEERVRRISRDHRHAKLKSSEVLLLDYALKLTHDPASVKREDVEELRRAGWSDDAILDAVLVASYFNFVNRVALGLGVELEADRGEGYRY